VSTAPVQQLAAGKLPQSQYGELPGFTATRMIAPLSRCFAMICGPPGEGKSTFCQSHPDSYTINFDLSSTSKHIRGTVWPGIHPETGLPVSNDGNRVHLNYNSYQAVINTLYRLAEEDKPRPEVIVYDSIDGLIPLYIRHLIEINQKTSWQDMDGRRAWGTLYDMVVQEWEKLRSYGYGVWLISHVVRTKIPIGEDKYHIGVDFTFGDGLWKRIEWALELVAGVERTEVTRTREIPQRAVKLKDGKVFTPQPKILTEKKAVYVFSTEGGDTEELKKQRLTFPDDIQLPDRDSWDTVNAAYRKAIESD
jgi:hypothetical protein